MLAANNVKVVGVGFEELGVQEFIDARYLDGGKYTAEVIHDNFGWFETWGESLESQLIEFQMFILMKGKRAIKL